MSEQREFVVELKEDEPSLEGAEYDHTVNYEIYKLYAQLEDERVIGEDDFEGLMKRAAWFHLRKRKHRLEEDDPTVSALYMKIYDLCVVERYEYDPDCDSEEESEDDE